MRRKERADRTELAKTASRTNGRSATISAWLETRRTANDSSATLVLAIDNSDPPGLADMFFEDNEEAGAAYGRRASAGPP